MITQQACFCTLSYVVAAARLTLIHPRKPYTVSRHRLPSEAAYVTTRCWPGCRALLAAWEDGERVGRWTSGRVMS